MRVILSEKEYDRLKSNAEYFEKSRDRLLDQIKACEVKFGGDSFIDEKKALAVVREIITDSYC